MISREHIINTSHDLFMKYGIRSISMSEVASKAGISKKTLYQVFEDKNALVDEVLLKEFNMGKEKCSCNIKESNNAVEEIFLTMQSLMQQFRNMNTAVIYDLQKYHHNSFLQFIKYKNEVIYKIIFKNIKRGIKEGWYRKRLNVDVLSKYRLESMMIALNVEVFPSSKYHVGVTMRIMLENFLFGLVSENGYKLCIQYQKEFFKKK